MALSDYIKRGQIGPSLKGQYYQYERNGRWVTANWPKKRGPARSQKQKNAEIAFAEACFAMKRTASEIQMFHRENAKGTPMLPRDSLMAALYGNGPAIHFYNGKVIKPMANKYLASTVLDAIGWEKGMLLYRSEDTWEPVPKGPNGYVLTFNATDAKPEWKAPAAAGGSGLYISTPMATGVNNQPPRTAGVFLRSYRDVRFNRFAFVPLQNSDGIYRFYFVLTDETFKITEIVARHDFAVTVAQSNKQVVVVLPDDYVLPADRGAALLLWRVSGFPSNVYGYRLGQSFWTGELIYSNPGGATATVEPAIGVTLNGNHANTRPALSLGI